MFKKLAVLGIGFLMLASLSGCATGKRNQSDLEIQGLRNQVLVLQSQVQSKDEEINALKDEAAKAQENEAAKKEIVVNKTEKNKGAALRKGSKRDIEIQTALKNAGFDPGPIDGKISKQTVEAIKDFQKVNKLHVTGKVNKATWRHLKVYLNKENK